MNEASSEARNRIALATSSGVPGRSNIVSASEHVALYSIVGLAEVGRAVVRESQ